MAIEERKEGEDLRPAGPSITELVEKESVDILPYIEWENKIGDETEVSGSAQFRSSLRKRKIFQKCKKLYHLE